MAPVLPHDPPKELAPDLFVVHGSVRVNPVVRFSRNMTIVRENGELTLISPVRMDDAGLSALEALGEVRHVMRLGPLHGMDDAFYVDRYGAKFWSVPDGITYTEPAVDEALRDGGPLPFASARLFVFGHLTEPEGAILLERDGGTLLTVDCIQSWASPPYRPHTNWLAKLLLPLIGFSKTTLIGPIWMKLLSADDVGVRREFERLLQWDFQHMLSAHGTYLASGAKAEVVAAYQKMFGAPPNL